jgi:hypothetical protein
MSIRRSLAILRAACVATIIAVFPGPAGACARHLVAGLAIESAATNPAVRVLLNGRPARLYFDTGAEHTILTAAAVGRLALPTDWLGFQPLWGIGGLSMHFNARVARFSVGGLVLPEESLAVGDFGATWRDSSDGLLGAEIIGRYDTDIDFSRGHVGLFRAVRCDHPAPGWKAPFTALKLRDLGPFRHVAITDARIDGAPVTATIDTGAERSTITRQAALRLGATEAALRADPASLMIGVGSQTQSYRLHEFGALMFGGAIWRAPKLMVGPLPPFLGDMLLGVDFLRRHRIWISWANGMVFVARPADKSDTKQGFAPRSAIRLDP